MTAEQASPQDDGINGRGVHSPPPSDCWEKDRYLPLENISRIMKKGIPFEGKIDKDAKLAVQKSVSEFIGLITSVARDKCQEEKRNTMNGEDILWAMETLEFTNFADPLKMYLNMYREVQRSNVGNVDNLDIQKKKRKKTEKMNNSENRLWGEMEKDVLLIIYQKLALKDLIIGAPLCCYSWYKISKEPSLWKDVNLRGFDSHKGKPVLPKQLIEFVVRRSEGSLNSIAFPSHASLDDLLLVAESCPKLKQFSISLPESHLLEGKETIGMSISKLMELESMEVDQDFISNESTLKQINQCCPNFKKLKVFDTMSKNTASLIATSLPKLKTLDVSSTQIHRKDVLVILKGCKELESLDLTKCGKIYNLDDILEFGKSLNEFKWDYEINDTCSECEEEWEEDSTNEGNDLIYRWPCEHVADQSWGAYIEGTYDLIDKLSPPDNNYVHLPSQYDAGTHSNEDYDDWDFECDCCYGYSAPKFPPMSLHDYYASL